MPCIRCGNPKTIKAHLLPQVFCKEVKVGTSFASMVNDSGSFSLTQSGVFDKNILCKECDGKLGKNEKYAAEAFRLIRQKSVGNYNGTALLANQDKEKILRFVAGILWKYSITQKEYGRIDLFGFQEDVKRIAYEEIEIPTWFDALLFRLKIHPNDDGVFAYRAPLPDKLDRVRIYRFMVGGILFFVKVHNKKMRNDPTQQNWLSQEDDLQYVIAPANMFEEYKILKDIAFNSEPLSSYLDKQDSISKNKSSS
jgi:hypothetical protein